MKCRICNSILDHTGACPNCGFDEGVAYEYYPTLQPIEGLSISGRRKKWKEKNAAQNSIPASNVKCEFNNGTIGISDVVMHFGTTSKGFESVASSVSEPSLKSIDCPANLHSDMSVQSKLLTNSFNTRTSSEKVSVPTKTPKSIKASAQTKRNDDNTDIACQKALKKRTVAKVFCAIISCVNSLLAAVAVVHDMLGDVSNIIIPVIVLSGLGSAFLSDAEDHPTYLNMLAVFCSGIAAAFIPFWLMVIADSASLDFCKVDDASALFIIPLCYAIGIYFAGVFGDVLSQHHVSSKSDIVLARVLTIIMVTVYCVTIWKNGAKDDTVKMIFLITPAIAVPLLLFKRTPPILVLLAFLSIGFAALCCFGLLSILLFESIGLADTAVAYAFMAVLGLSGLVFGIILAQACTIDR